MDRINDGEWQKSIYKDKKSNKSSQSIQIVETIELYTNRGNNKINADGNYIAASEKSAYAKLVVDEVGRTYYIRSYGHQFLNPLDMYASQYSNTSHTHEWKKVNEKTFGLYMKFLNTENTMYLDIIKREQ